MGSYKKRSLIVNKRNLLFGLFVTLILLLDVRFFDSKSLGETFYNINNNHNKFLISSIVLLSFLLCAINGKIRFNKKNVYDRYIILYIIIVLITYILSLIVYNQSPVDVFKSYHYYLILPLYFVLRCQIRDKSQYEILKKAIVYIATIYALTLIFAKIIYTTNGTFLLSTELLTITHRNSSLRLLGGSGLVPLAAAISFGSIFQEKKNRIPYATSFAICATQIVYVSQTRMIELSLLIAVCSVIYLNATQKRKFLLIILGGIVVVAMYSSILEFFSSFSVNNDDMIYAYSTSIRLEAYEHYIKNMFRNGFIGIGFINSDNYQTLKFGASGRYVLSDLGYIGVIGVFGILGVVLISYFLYIMYQQLKMILSKANRTDYADVISVTIYIVVSSWSLIFNDNQRLLYLPLYFSMFEFIRRTGLIIRL